MTENLSLGGWFPLISYIGEDLHIISNFSPIPAPALSYRCFKLKGTVTSTSLIHSEASHNVARGSIALTAQAEGHTYTIGLTFNIRAAYYKPPRLGAVLLYRPFVDADLMVKYRIYQVFHPLKPPQASWGPAPESDSGPADLLQASLQGVDIYPYRQMLEPITPAELWDLWRRLDSPR